MSVVYYLARKSHRSPRYISNLRLRGSSWWDISLRLGLNPRALYFNDRRDYGKSYGHYKHKKRHLRDVEIINLINTRFISNYHQVNPREVISRRKGGERYRNIDEYYRTKKLQQRTEKRYKKHDSKTQRRNDKGYDRGHGKKKRYDRY